MSFGGELLRPFRGALATARRSLSLAFAFAIIIGFAAGQAQSQGVTSDQLQQLQQLQQAQQGRGTSSTTAQPGVTQREIILQPTDASAPQPVSRLEQILSERVGTKLRQYGYDQLGGGRSVSLPQVGGMQDNYVLGAGDEIVLTLRGQENNEYRVTVDRDGQVFLPKLNPVSAAGRTFGQFRQDVANAIRRAYVSTEGFVSVGRLRQISVLVSGEVGSPGVRTLTGLSTPVDAILVSGGVKKSGSLRNIRILRGGREISVDLYSLLTGQARASATNLTDGDRIVVPPLNRTIAIVGWVRKAGIYELPAGRSTISVREFIALAGGTEVHGKYRLSLLHAGSDGRSQMTTVEDGVGSVGDGDILFVNPSASESSSVATLSGGTALAGKYAATGGKLSQLLKSPGALGEDPYTLFGIISRRDRVNKFRFLVPFTPAAVLNGTEDMTIQSDDIVRVITANEARSLFLAVQQFRIHRNDEKEAAINPQAATRNDNLDQTNNRSRSGNSATTDRTQSGSFQAGGTQVGGSQAGGNPAGGNQAGGSQAGNSQMGGYQAGGAGMTGSDALSSTASSVDLALQQAQGNRSDAAGLSQRQAASGSNAAMAQFGQDVAPQRPPSASEDDTNEPETGVYNISRKGEVRRLSDLAAQLRVDPLVLNNFLNDRAINVDGAVQGPGLYLVGPTADVQSVLAAAGGASRTADRSNVEIISTTVDSNRGQSRTVRRTLSLADPANASFIVGPSDEMRVNEVFTDAGVGSVTVQGEVRHTGTYQIVRGEHLSDLLVRAGGLTDTAYPYGTVFLRRSAALREQDSYRRQAQTIDNQLIVAMTRRDAGAKMSPESFSAMQSYVQEIRNQKGLGRVVVTADPAILAANPSADPLLEPNDVVYIPQRPYSIAVLGEVLQPGSIPFRSDMSADDYLAAAGGYSSFADSSETFIVLPDGSARRKERSWFHLDSETVPPGSTIFVARDVSGVDMHQAFIDITSIASQLAVTAASLAVLSKQ